MLKEQESDAIINHHVFCSHSRRYNLLLLADEKLAIDDKLNKPEV